MVYKQEIHLQKNKLNKNGIHALSVRNVFLSNNGLCNHMNVHRGKYNCAECGKCCDSSRRLAEHRRSYSGKRPLECSVCSRRVKISEHLALHMHCVHGSATDKLKQDENVKFDCTVCGQRCTTVHCLAVHSRVHSGEKPYKCYMCDMAFTQAGNLKVHMRVHTGQKPYKCHTLWQGVYLVWQFKQTYKSPHERETIQLFTV